jgi:hypothetical protein
MANKKITELDAVTTLASTDVVPVVDVSADTTNKITAANLFRTLPDGTAAAPALAFSSDAANGVYLAGTDTVGISTGGTQRVTVDGSGNVTISGDLTVSGANTTVESTTVTIDDKNIELGSVASPSDTTADGGGITLKGATDKTIKWINSTGYWTFNTGIDVGGNIELADSSRIKIGTGDDLEIYHDGSNSYLSNNTGDLRIAQTLDDGDILLQADDSSGGLANYIFCDGSSGRVVLSHYGSGKLETKSDGVDITGELLCDSAGIGASSPSSALHVSGTDTAYSGNVAVGAIATISDTAGRTVQVVAPGTVGEGGIGTSTNHDFTLFTGNTEKVRLTQAGNLGIGTSAPTVLLDLESTSPTIRLTDSDASGTPECQISGAGGDLVLEADRDNEKSDSLIRFEVDGSEHVRITGSGNVGIGATSFTEKLRVSGAYNQTGLTVLAGGAGYSSPLIVGTANGTEYMRVDDDGRVLSGVASAPGTVGGFSHLNIKGTSINANGAIGLYRNTASPSAGQGIGAIYFANSDGNAGAYIQGQSDGTWGTNDYPGRLVFFTTADGASSATERLRVDSSGRLMLGTTTEGDVNADDLTIANSGNCGMTIRSGTSSFGGIFFSDGTSGDAEYQGQILYDHNSSYMRFQTGATERLRIDSSGHLNLVSSTSGLTDLNFTASDLNVYARVAGGKTGSGVGDLRFYTYSGGLSEAMRIDSSGRLLLGTTTEGRASATDNLTIASSGDSGITIRSGTSNDGAIDFSDGTSGAAEYSGQILYDHGSNFMRFMTASTERFRITSTGAFAIEGASNYGTSGQVLTSNGNDAPTWQDAGAAVVGGASAISMNDSVKVKFGASDDLEIFHDGTHSYIENNTNDLIIRNRADNQDVVLMSDNSSGGVTQYVRCDGSSGNVRLYYYGSQKFQTESGGIDVTGTVKSDGLDVDGASDLGGNVSVSSGNLSMHSGGRIFVGNGGNAVNPMFANVSDTNTGIAFPSADNLLIAAGGETAAKFIGNGAVELYYNNSKKLETKSDGVDIIGELQCDSLDNDGSSNFAGDCSFFGGAAAVQIEANSDIRFVSGTWTGDATKIQHHSNTLYIQGGSSGIQFRHVNGTDRCHIDANGHFLPNANNTYDLGNSSLRWRNVYTNDLNLSNEGSTNDVDGTWGNYTIQEGEDDLFLINRRNGKKYKFNLTEVS